MTGAVVEEGGDRPGNMQNGSIIVIGASAGGVEVLRELVSGIPRDFPAPICIALHIPAHGVSYLPEILRRAGKLPARHPEIMERLSPGTIYIAPPDEHLVVQQGFVELSHAPRENHSRPSIDVLFRSAAQAFGERAVGVILSGTRDDGALGLRLIRMRGGYGIVQDPRDALFPGMPESALAIAGADSVLPARDIPTALRTIVGGAWGGFVREPWLDESVLDPLAISEAVTTRPSVFSCPECGGVLWEHDSGNISAFRCRIGHAYAPESLFEAQDESAESSIRMAVRVLEEQSDLAGRLELRARSQKKEVVANRFARERDEAARKADILRRLIEQVRRPANVDAEGVA